MAENPYKKHRFIILARREALLDAIENGVKDIDALSKIANEAELDSPMGRGIRTEKRFDRLAEESKLIIMSRLASEDEDNRKKIDRWITLENDIFEKPLPVQIKSSDKGIYSFRKSRHYHKLHNERIVVINCGDRNITTEEFDRAILEEVERIKRIS